MEDPEAEEENSRREVDRPVLLCNHNMYTRWFLAGYFSIVLASYLYGLFLTMESTRVSHSEYAEFAEKCQLWIYRRDHPTICKWTEEQSPADWRLKWLIGAIKEVRFCVVDCDYLLNWSVIMFVSFFFLAFSACVPRTKSKWVA